METTLYIKNKNKLKRSFQFLGKMKKWITLEIKDNNKWMIYEKGDLLIRVECEFIIDSIIIKFFMPLIGAVTKADEMLLRPLLLEKEIRVILKTDKLTLQGETIYLNKNIKLNVNKKGFTASLLNHITEIINTGDLISNIVQNEVDSVSQIKLN